MFAADVPGPVDLDSGHSPLPLTQYFLRLADDSVPDTRQVVRSRSPTHSPLLSARHFVPGAKNFARDAPRSRPDYHRRVTRAGYRRSALTHEQVRPTTSDGLQPLLAAKRTGASTRSRLVISARYEIAIARE